MFRMSCACPWWPLGVQWGSEDTGNVLLTFYSDVLLHIYVQVFYLQESSLQKAVT